MWSKFKIYQNMSLTKSYVKSKKTYKVTFEIPKEWINGAKEVRVLGDFNNWDWEKAPVLKNNKGILKSRQELKEGQKYEYRYLTNENVWLNDDKADAYAPSEYADAQNCVLDLS